MKVGILGGGQLGRMLLQAAANYVVETYVLENDENCPAAHLCHHFVKGSIKDFDTVYSFGKQLDALTLEIEAVNVEALEKLEAEGRVRRAEDGRLSEGGPRLKLSGGSAALAVAQRPGR